MWNAGVTAVHLAVQRGNSDAVRCLLSAGADVNVVDTKYCRPALYYPLQRNDVTTAELLIAYGARPVLSPYSTKCSTDILHSTSVYHHLPACCPTGTHLYTLLAIYLCTHLYTHQGCSLGLEHLGLDAVSRRFFGTSRSWRLNVSVSSRSWRYNVSVSVRIYHEENNGSDPQETRCQCGWLVTWRPRIDFFALTYSEDPLLGSHIVYCYPSVCLYVCLSVCLFVCPSVPCEFETWPKLQKV